MAAFFPGRPALDFQEYWAMVTVLYIRVNIRIQQLVS